MDYIQVSIFIIYTHTVEYLWWIFVLYNKYKLNNVTDNYKV